MDIIPIKNKSMVAGITTVKVPERVMEKLKIISNTVREDLKGMKKSTIILQLLNEKIKEEYQKLLRLNGLSKEGHEAIVIEENKRKNNNLKEFYGVEKRVEESDDDFKPSNKAPIVYEWCLEAALA